MTDYPEAVLDAANAWAATHGLHQHEGITACNATPLESFAAGMAAERERIRQLAGQLSAVYVLANSADYPADFKPFADLLTEGDTT